MKQKIVIVDYGIGNVQSVINAISFLGYKNLKVSDNEKVISCADVLILPGVGAFDESVKNLRERKLDIILNEAVLVNKKPILGICLGMQMFATYSEEKGFHQGLNWIEGGIKKLKLPKTFAVPHVGWNNIQVIKTEPLFSKNADDNHFYFDHSYHYVCSEEYVAAFCDYGENVVAAVQNKNIFGVQFHPEKSHTSGLKLFRSFFNFIS